MQMGWLMKLVKVCPRQESQHPDGHRGGDGGLSKLQ